MANQVFANDLEIACKAAEGASKACFPDVCLTPPSPPAGWIPVPYVNTTYAKDTANASKTVFITNKPVMLKDYSYFKTSNGNEPSDGPKGVITGAKKGKAYFRTWSMNVKVEGYNVTRHTDLMTHNHNPAVGNTVTWQYLDSASLKESCKSENKKIEKACDHSKDEKKDPKKKKQNWKQRKCDGLNLSPVSPNSAGDPRARLQELSDDIQGAMESLDIEQAVIDVGKEVALEIGERVAEFGVKQLVKKVPIIGWAYQAYTLMDDINEVRYMSQVSGAVKKEATRMSDQLKNIPNRFDNLNNNIDMLLSDNLSDDQIKSIASKKGVTEKNGRLVRTTRNGKTQTVVTKEGKLTKDGKAMLGGEVQGDLSDMQRAIATLNPCTRARKCTLLPYKETGSKDHSSDKKSELGCCPGQTKHHLIPDAFFKNRDNASQCNKYDYDKAPTICAEGTSQYFGSHGALHTEMDTFSADDVDPETNNISYEDARDASIKCVTQVFPLSMCSEDCLRAQLDNYYKDISKCSDDSDLKFSKIGAENDKNTDNRPNADIFNN